MISTATPGQTSLSIGRTLADGFSDIPRSTTAATAPATSSGASLTDKPLGADFDGDGKIDPGVFRPSSGEWFIRLSSTGYGNWVYYQWGLPTDVPLVGDFDGDGKADLSVFRPSDGGAVRSATPRAVTVPAAGRSISGASSTDTPLTGDFDGDGRTDIAVFRPSDGGWYIRYSTRGYSDTLPGVFQWGKAGDQPLTGDFDGDGNSDIAVFRPSDGGVQIPRSSAGYSTNSWLYLQWGLSTDTPIASDFDRDGKTDLAVFRPSDGGWYVDTRRWGTAPPAGPISSGACRLIFS